jgi:type IV pilus assembly protein PilA
LKLETIKKRQRGQGMTEYIIIVALIAVAAIAVYQLFGQTIRSQMAGITKEVSGQDGAGQVANATSAANQAATESSTKRGLSDYTGNDSRGTAQGGGGGSGTP